MASFIALLFAKNMALLPLGEPKNDTENELAERDRFLYQVLALPRAKVPYFLQRAKL